MLDVTASYRKSHDLHFWVFSYIIDDHSCLVSSPNFHRLSAQLIDTFWYVNKPNVTAGYGTPLDFIAFFGIFTHN